MADLLASADSVAFSLQESVQQSHLSIQCCNLPQLLNAQKNVLFIHRKANEMFTHARPREKLLRQRDSRNFVSLID